VHSEKNWFNVHFERDGEDYVFRDMRPGRYRAEILSEETTICTSDWFELAAGERLHLGTLASAPGGALRIELVRTPGTEALEQRVYLRPEDSAHGRWLDFGRESTRLVESLNPGSWSLSLYSDGLANRFTEAEGRAGETASVRIELRAAVLREIELAFPDGVTLGELRLDVRDEAGNELWVWTDPQPADRGRPYRRELQLPLGLIRVRVETRVELSAALELTMSSLEPDQPPVRLELR
jgi:hypothetical protein